MADASARSTGSSIVDIPFSREAFDDVKRLAKESNKSVERFIQESIAVNGWVSEVVRDGGKVIAEKNGHRAKLNFK